jgi:hypothetical protein
MRFVSLLIVPGFVLAAAAPASAQRAAFTGRVLDDATDAPVPNAAVALLTESGATVGRTAADADGRFVVSVRVAGRYRLLASSIGYDDAFTAAIDVAPGDTLHVIVRMNIQAIRLPALEVEARSRGSPVLEGFHYRRQRGLGGSFITRDDIELRGPTRVSDLLRETGLEVYSFGTFRGSITNSRMNCAPTVYIDGIRVAGTGSGRPGEDFEAFDAVNLLHPSSLEGIEVYRGAATLPPEFGGSTGRCGAIGIWTRRGT